MRDMFVPWRGRYIGQRAWKDLSLRSPRQSGWVLFPCSTRGGWPSRAEMAKHKTRRCGRERVGLEAAEGRGEKEEEEKSSDGEGEGSEVATSPRKSRVMPTRNCTTPRAPLPTPRSRLALTPPGTPPRPFLPVLSPSPRFSHPFPAHPPQEIPPTDPRVWCAFSPASTRVTSPISPTPRE